MTRPKRPRAADAPEVLVALDPRDRRPLHQQVSDGLREAILAGKLPTGARLPSTRALAADLGVARTTVTLAFDQLRAEGYIAGRRGGGTRVRSQVPDGVVSGARGIGDGARVDRRPRAVPSRVAPRSPHQDHMAALSRRGRILAQGGAGASSEGSTPPVPFRLGVPALEQFPTAVWTRLTMRRWRRGGVHLGDGDPGGERALREAIAAHVTVARGARCTADQIIVLGGTHQAIDLASRLLLDPGDVAWVEDPSYLGARLPLVMNGIELAPVPVDAEGIDVRAGDRLAPHARLVYVTPSHQFPLGVVMSAERRLALIDWARRRGAWIIEDDYDSEFRYTGRPLPCLQGLDAECCAAPRVLYVGTFSKTLVPALRLAYLIVPDALVDATRAARAVTDRHSSTLSQGVLADFIAEGHYARHVRRVRTLYAERQEILRGAARRELAGLLDLPAHETGLHLVGRLRDGLRDVDVVARAAAAGVRSYALSVHHGDPTTAPQGLILGYAGYDERAITEGVRRLARAIEGMRD